MSQASINSEAPYQPDQGYEAYVNNRAENMGNYLRDRYPDLWTGPVIYGDYNQNGESGYEKLQRKLGSIAQAAIRHGYADDLDSDFNTTNEFIERSFALYEGREVLPTESSFAFIVPTRISRHHDGYVGEIRPFVPLFEHLDRDTRIRAVAGLPPAVISNYFPDQQGKQGRLIFAPAMIDMAEDLGWDAAGTAKQIINDAVGLARRLNANVVGLGAIFPKLTNYGQALDRDGIEVTTGHGGTIYLIAETVKKVAESTDVDLSKGAAIIGAAGSIGRATTEYLADIGIVDKVVLFDKNPVGLKEANTNAEKLFKQVEHYSGSPEGSEAEKALAECDVIISATTTPINLDHFPGLDLTGKVIVDDSQPGCFNRQQVEARGGRLVWVVGHDGSEGAIFSRIDGYDYGNFVYPNDVWGCEAEAGSIAASGRLDLALGGPVTADKVRGLAEVFNRYNITPSSFQSWNAAVELPDKRLK